MIRRVLLVLAWELALLHIWHVLVLLVRAFVAYRTAPDPEPALEALRAIQPDT